ncbi:hypothetical protein [Eudoraea adriatica]|uniref:hypothetical protein n=1 Tax=Eudoraea adriatica TaxID=446681 RepID=UPI001969EAD3|nr:hypothetical protein [Eudoraea adriatica]
MASIYHIIIKGKITASLRHVGRNMQIRQEEENVIDIIGCLPNQSALLNLLSELINIRQEIISVQILSTT